MVIAVVNVVDVVDGVHAAIVPGEVAVVAGKGGLVMMRAGSFSVWVAAPVAFVVVCIPTSKQSAICVFFSEAGSSWSGGSVWRVVQ